MTPQPTSQHLTEEQLADLLASPNLDTAAQAHLQGCPECRAEVDALQSSVSLFRTAITAAAERETLPSPRAVLARAKTGSRLLRPSLLAASLAVAAASAALLHRSTPAPTPTPQPAQVITASDEALLNEVDSDLSATAPAPLQVLQVSTQVSRSR